MKAGSSAMTKRPPEIRHKRPDDIKPFEKHERIELNKKCIYCGGTGDLKVTSGYICIECFEEYCETCEQRKPYITVKRDPKNQNHDHRQICSDCYSALSNDIVNLDASYGIEDIDSKKSTRYK